MKRKIKPTTIKRISRGFMLLFGVRHCVACNITKPTSEFHIGQVVCKECRIPKCKEYKIRNKDKVDAYKERTKRQKAKHAKDYYSQDHIKQQYKEYAKEYRKTERGKHAAIRRMHKRRILSDLVENTLTLDQWKTILNNQENKCAVCGKRFSKSITPTRDHIIPVSRGGGLTFENTQALCQSCNSKKRDTLNFNLITTWSEIVFIDPNTPLTWEEAKAIDDLSSPTPEVQQPRNQHKYPDDDSANP